MLHRSTTKSLLCGAIIRHFRTINTNTSPTTKDDYFATIHHIANIVRREVHPERTLNKLDIPVTSELVFRVLRACSNSPSESLRFFQWARSHYSPTSLEFEELIKILACHHKYSSMWSLIDQNRKYQNNNYPCQLSPSTVSFIIEQYGKHGLIDHAVQIFNKCQCLNCQQTVDVYNSLLFALCEVKLFHGAYALIRRMIQKGVVPDKRTYATLVNAWCSTDKLREAQEFLEEMSKKGFNPPVRGHDLLIEGLLNAGFLESAKDMVRKMTKEGFVPYIDTFNSFIEGICKSGDVEFCVDMYHCVCKLGLRPNINTYKILIPAVSKLGGIDEAFKLLHNSIEDGHKPFPSLYAPIIKAMCWSGQFDDALSFFGEMKVKGHPPNRPVYTMVITMCGRGGRFIDAANYLVEMTEMGLTPISRCFDMVIDGLKNCGKHDLANKIENVEISLRGA